MADVICLNETFASDSHNRSLSVPNYTLFQRWRRDCYKSHDELCRLNGGGVGIYISNSLQAQMLSCFQNVTDLEYIVVEIIHPYKAVIVTAYRPPQFSVSECIRYLKRLLDHLSEMSCDVIIISGDLNEDQFSNRNKPLYNLFTEYGYQQLITSSTTEKGTLLDTIFVRDSDVHKVKATGIIQTYYSYHDAVFCLLEV